MGSDEWVSRYHPLKVLLSRTLQTNERFVLVVGTMDVSDLCTRAGDTVIYRPEVFPLPSGQVPIFFFLVSGDSAWTPAGGSDLKVLRPTGFEKLDVSPSLSIANKGQLAEDHFPEGSTGGRSRFQELNGSFALSTHAERGPLAVNASFNLVGASLKQEALRFSEKHDDATKIDLSQYLLELHMGPASVAAGQVSHGRHRELLNGFSSRGLSGGVTLGSFFDISGAVLSATNIVGWDNFFGIHDSRHRIYSGTLGLEAFPGHPGMVRMELSYVQGSQLPFSGFNQAGITDAEESKSGGARLLVSDPARTVTVDAGIAWSRFVNPADVLLSQNNIVVPVAPATRQARYVDFGWDLLQGISAGPALPVRLSIAARHERVDPLYKVVGAFVRSDFLQNSFELHGGLGPLRCDATALSAEDNLANVPSVLKTKTRQAAGTLALSQSSGGELLPSWFPGFSYGLNRTHQFGVSTPTNSDFTPERVPDQVTTSHSITADWQERTFQVSYRGAFTFQDNRQVGRENADLKSNTHALGITLSLRSGVSIGVDGSQESNANTEINLISRTTHVGLRVSGQPLPGSNVSFSGSLSRTKPNTGTSRQDQASLSVDTSYSFDLSSLLVVNWRGQVFARYAWNEVRSDDTLFNVHSLVRAWSISTGVSFSIL